MKISKKFLRSGLVAAMTGTLMVTTPGFAAAAEAPATEAPAKETPADDDAATPGDLKPVIRVAAGKVPGFAGLVSISAENVGGSTYYQEFPLTTFCIDVKTAKGPKGVDRLITPGHFNGAYTRDLGFDRKTSTRSFEVTLSNSIRAGKGALLANLNFGDGDTDRGRLINYITVSQVGRPDSDKTTDNDQNVDSRDVAVTDVMGKKHSGLF